MHQAATVQLTSAQEPDMPSISYLAQASINNRLTKQLHAQHGVTLVELMVGIAIGLLVVAVAMGALMVSRGVSGTVTDASTIQQQAAYAMRVFGLQLRQAGSLRLNLNPGLDVTEAPFKAGVAFEAKAEAASNPAMSFDAGIAEKNITGTDSPDTLTVGFRRYTEPVFTNAAEVSLSRNCLGGPADPSTDQLLSSAFQLDAAQNVLRCSGNGILPAQPILQNVANFQVRYLVQNTAVGGIPTFTTVEASAVTNWAQVQAVEVCLVLFGAEPIDLPVGSTYRDCDSSNVDMSSLTGVRANRMHMVFRNVFQLRSQGLIGSAIL